MPYIGLLDKYDREIVGGGYHRIDMTELSFKLSPSSDPGRWHYAVLLDQEVSWVAQDTWLEVWALAVFDEIDDREPINSALLNSGPCQLRKHDKLRVQRGALKLDVVFTGNRARKPR